MGVGASAAARTELNRTYWLKWDANEAYCEARDNYYQADRKQVVRAAKRAREAAQAAAAAAAAVWHQTSEAALMRELRARCIENGTLLY